LIGVFGVPVQLFLDGTALSTTPRPSNRGLPCEPTGKPRIFLRKLIGKALAGLLEMYYIFCVNRQYQPGLTGK
jgi:hypothetical protein